MESFSARHCFAMFAMMLFIAILPHMAAGCIITNNPCDCQLRCTTACGYTSPLSEEIILILTGTTGKAFAWLLPLASFYWAMRKPKCAFLWAIGIWLSWLSSWIIAAGTLFVLEFLSSNSNSLILMLETVICVFFYNCLFFWLWRKKMIWWKAIIIPLLIAILYGGIDIGISFGFFKLCTL